MWHDTRRNAPCRFQAHPRFQPHQARQLWKLPARQPGEISARFAWAANALRPTIVPISAQPGVVPPLMRPSSNDPTRERRGTVICPSRHPQCCGLQRTWVVTSLGDDPSPQLCLAPSPPSPAKVTGLFLPCPTRGIRLKLHRSRHGHRLAVRTIGIA
jgi:hypothetical protein